MSTDQDKSGKGGGDRPVLFGPANDPLLADRIEKLTGDALDSTIARLDAFADKMFSDTSEEDPFPFGVEEERDHMEVPTPTHTADSDDLEAADGLDRILDTLSAEPDVVAEIQTTPAAKVSLKDLERQFDIGEEVLTAPTSPIGEVLARTGMAEGGRSEGGYHDPGLDDPDLLPYAQETPAPEDMDDDGHEVAADPYDPLSDVFDDPASDETDVISPDDMDLFGDDEDYTESFADSEDEARGSNPEFDPLDDIFPDEDLPAAQADTSDTDTSRGFGLPEPSPYGDQDGMGGLYGYGDDDDDEAEAERADMGSEQETDPEQSQPDETEDWLMADQDEGADTHVAPVVAEKARPFEPQDGSALEGLITDLRWGGNARQQSAPEPEPVPEVKTARSDQDQVDPDPVPAPVSGAKIAIPAFLRRDSGRPRLGDLTDPALTAAPVQEETWQESDPVAEVVPEPVDADPVEDAATEQGVDTPEPQTEPRKGRKRLLAGVAVLALVAMTGAGAFLLMSGPAPVRTASAPETGFVPLPDPGTFIPAPPAMDPGPGAVEGTDQATFAPLDPVGPTDPVIVRVPLGDTDGAPATPTAQAQIDPVEVADAAPASADQADVIDPAPVAEDQIAASETSPVTAETTGTPTVPTEVSDLLAQINQGSEPAPDGASKEQVEAIDSRLADVEAITAAAQDRSVELAGELTGLTDQITALLQRDSDQAERLDRMERLIRGQSALLAQFGQMEESLEQTQVVLLDVSARIGAVEGQNPADRDAVNRALADIEGRLQALTANMSILARMSIEGVDTLRAPGASSGTVGVQTAPQASDQRGGGSDTVFRSETGGFRISSDAAGRIPAGVKKDDFIEGYGYVLDVLPASDGKRLVVMENGSVLVPSAE